MGVEHKRGENSLKSVSLENLKKRHELLSKVRSVNNKVVYIFLSKEEILECGYSYDDIHSISGVLRDCDSIEVAFVFFEEKPNQWRCSMRTTEWLNANDLLSVYGGGGTSRSGSFK